MIKETAGDLLECQANILCHQVNCQGVMGAGIARQIREKILTRNQFLRYKTLCSRYGSELLGHVLYLKVVPNKKYIANIFGQNECGNGIQTDYRALSLALQKVHNSAKKYGFSVAVPGYIGCGLAGGDWDYVLHSIIEPIFKNSIVELTICYLDGLPEDMEKGGKNND